MNLFKPLSLILAIAVYGTCNSQETDWNTPGAGNPFIPGYFADPTIRKFGDTYYIYATTDGTGNGYGPPQVWMSNDFVNWRNVTMNWPTTEVVWAPDVVQQPDGSFRYYYCTPCEIRVGESDKPTGPWKNRLGVTDAVLVPDRFVHNAITLDPQLFRDDDGSEYLYFGTWGIYKGFGCGVAKLSADGKSFTDKKLIENTEITDFFEAPFVFKKNGRYYFTYSSGSCHDDTYRVQYAISDQGPMGPYTYKGCILKTNSDGTVHGPGHHSVLVDGNNYYIVYHRHNLPRSIHGFHRQLCIDKLEFDDNGDIKPVVPTHSGLLPASLVNKSRISKNLAFNAKVIASSVYSDWFKASYATDDNNGTLWRASRCNGPEWIEIDLGSAMHFNEIFTQFEYATFFYQYKIETSVDGKTWKMYADRLNNVYQGSPMVDTGDAMARYIRITITDTQKNGHFPAIWNVKVYDAIPGDDPLALLPDVKIDEDALIAGYPWIHTKDVMPLVDRSPTGWIDNRIIDIDASDYTPGKLVTIVKNKGIAGDFKNSEGIPVVPKEGKLAFRFDGNHSLVSTFNMPRTMVYNAPYSINAWIFNPEVDELECVAQFMPVVNDLATIELRNGKSRSEGIIAHNASFENTGSPDAVKAGKWQFWTVVYDGYMEKVYCDGVKVAEKNNFLMLRPEGPVTIGSSFFGNNPFSGYIHSLEFYDRPLDDVEISQAYSRQSDITEAQKSEFAKINHVKDKEFSIITTPISPNASIIRITDNKGNDLEQGLYDYSFGTSPTNMVASANNSMIVSFPEGSSMVYGRVNDLFGNSSAIIKQKVKRKNKDFKELSGLLNIPLSADGSIVLESDHTDLRFDSDGPLSLVEVNGDFVLQCKVIDMTGMNRHSTPAYNEGGIIVVNERGDATHNLVHLGIFPNYNCGNMLTVVSSHGRPQYKNNKGWDFDPYIQLERRGNQIYARSSVDGITWSEMPNSPVDCGFMKGASTKVGLYQTTYSENHAYVKFDDVRIWVKK